MTRVPSQPLLKAAAHCQASALRAPGTNLSVPGRGPGAPGCHFPGLRRTPGPILGLTLCCYHFEILTHFALGPQIRWPVLGNNPGTPDSAGSLPGSWNSGHSDPLRCLSYVHRPTDATTGRCQVAQSGWAPRGTRSSRIQRMRDPNGGGKAGEAQVRSRVPRPATWDRRTLSSGSES